MIQLEDTLTARDAKRYIAHRFTVPPGARRLELRLRFAPAVVHGVHNHLALTLFDPDGFRGAGHRGGASHDVVISHEAATPGYLPGPLPPGEWIAEVHTHMIMPGAPLRYRLEVAVSEVAITEAEAPRPAPRAAPATSPSAEAAPTGPAWLKGDLHTHTHHSDADDFTVADLVEQARRKDLDFVFLTDHNTNAGLHELTSTPDLLTCDGFELTTFWGHALCLGARTWIDWRVDPGSGVMPAIAARAYTRGELFVIAHPLADGDPGCTGCAWRFGEMMPGNARMVEIWNGPWGCDSNNEDSLALWYDWLNQGHRLVATAGTDTHGPDGYGPGTAFSVVRVAERTQAGILAGLAAGAVVLTAGPELRLEARDAQGGTHLPGDTVRGPASLTARWANCPPGATVRLMAHGRLMDARTADGTGAHTWSLTPADAAWLVVEIR
ncbi:MAG: CehA/McbA family metallohydrolase, partial [Anaerolineae bacterium]